MLLSMFTLELSYLHTFWQTQTYTIKPIDLHLSTNMHINWSGGTTPHCTVFTNEQSLTREPRFTSNTIPNDLESTSSLPTNLGPARSKYKKTKKKNSRHFSVEAGSLLRWRKCRVGL
ncbi:hypothetical protein FQA47_017356 [Oryzias melastigma]|uniref:Uncharacterized protein n=1 Tax=Oryzias melastigma TaxID=30732 RepID=A0A834BTA5_ORYME|nr:hypothetical protein FQA47_017356 [Oryzias melastigma]